MALVVIIEMELTEAQQRLQELPVHAVLPQATVESTPDVQDIVMDMEAQAVLPAQDICIKGVMADQEIIMIMVEAEAEQQEAVPTAAMEACIITGVQVAQVPILAVMAVLAETTVEMVLMVRFPVVAVAVLLITPMVLLAGQVQEAKSR